MKRKAGSTIDANSINTHTPPPSDCEPRTKTDTGQTGTNQTAPLMAVEYNQDCFSHAVLSRGTRVAGNVYMRTRLIAVA